MLSLYIIGVLVLVPSIELEVSKDGNIAGMKSDYAVSFDMNAKLGLRLSKDLTVLGVSTTSAADPRKIIRAGDQVAAVNGMSVFGWGQGELMAAIKRIKSAPESGTIGIEFSKGPSWQKTDAPKARSKATQQTPFDINGNIVDVPYFGKLPAGKVPLGIAISLNPYTGWGQQGLHLFEPLGKYHSLLLVMPKKDCIDQEYSLKSVFDHTWNEQRKYTETVHVSKKNQVLQLPYPVLHGVGGAFSANPKTRQNVWGTKNVGYAVFEAHKLSTAQKTNAHMFDLVLTSSQWNYDVLKSTGINAARIIQGVDIDLFHPRQDGAGSFDWSAFKDSESRKLGSSKFVIFSGGKLELRKGQDIVVAAFRKFVATHPNAILLTSWHNAYPDTMKWISEPGLVKGLPKMKKQARGMHIDFEGWLQDNGVSKKNALCLQSVPPKLISQILQRADAAIFPNRCEGSTNFVAMEALASGVPSIISNNTGHTEIVRPDHCFPLVKQTKLKPPLDATSLPHWRDSDVDEVVSHLETIYNNPHDARALGVRAAEFMRNTFTWEMANQAWADTMVAHGIE
jgi:glycosyltransferase involved in cell wall biosynthesis